MYTTKKGATMLDAHRGVSTEYPENTMSAFKAASEQGYEVIELDPAVTKDGVIVFTYGFDINKYENGDTTDKLKDAQFAIYYYDTDGVTKKYLVVENGLFKGATVAEPTAATKSVWTSTETDNIVIKGLDAGTYYIQVFELKNLHSPIVVGVFKACD